MVVKPVQYSETGRCAGLYLAFALLSGWSHAAHSGREWGKSFSQLQQLQEAALLHRASADCDAWLPDLMKIASWVSPAMRCQHDITVVTQLSFDR